MQPLTARPCSTPYTVSHLSWEQLSIYGAPLLLDEAVLYWSSQPSARKGRGLSLKHYLWDRPLSSYEVGAEMGS